MTSTTRAAIVGTGHRSQLFTEGLAHREHIEVAAFCDPNPVRMEHHNRVVTEKPMATDADRCRKVLDTVNESDGDLSVAFNHRFNPVHELVRREISSGAIGEVLSVHFEWLLDVRHGADYFRRWHREKDKSGGLMVHKASHHFDLVNGWLGARPLRVLALFDGEDSDAATATEVDGPLPSPPDSPPTQPSSMGDQSPSTTLYAFPENRTRCASSTALRM